MPTHKTVSKMVKFPCFLKIPCKRRIDIMLKRKKIIKQSFKKICFQWFLKYPKWPQDEEKREHKQVRTY